MTRQRIEAKLSLPKPSGRCLDAGFQAALLRSLGGGFTRQSDMLNRHEETTAVLLDEMTADNDSTLDLGDIDGEPFWKEYNFLKVELHGLKPATDGDVLYIRFGGAGSWWTAANYDVYVRILGVYSTSTINPNQTSIQCWTNASSYNQGNLDIEDLNGWGRISLATGDGIAGGRSFRFEIEWANALAPSDLETAMIMGRYPTTSHISAVRLWYDGGNIYGTGRLKGLPR